MKVANEVIELLVQSAGTWLFEGHRSGLTDREWMALRFLARANRFSKTPSALATYLGTTRTSASQIAAVLAEKGLLTRKASTEDKRSIALSVTPQGTKFLDRDPISALRDQVVILELADRTRLRDALRQALLRLDTALRRHHTDVCSECMFLAERSKQKGSHFECRLFRKELALKETELLCTHFERRT
ncbi:MarR family transcriptional regulator [Bradyrhizobium sp. CSS354]|jgi:MarR family transcriptional regulator, negative regulator of the multidrug operon emrRAB|uniref:MarR family transcriptional regulator n=1 Tax=unclassified Bradyrhizobium TaxID=2631580 RepID=UPI0023B14A77|nr:MarR family transcriptional regulator [Bradyrhizobium sp. CSS354]MDE5462494.1 MarR family transcriptional regulator [Bradyrhizobium sp. CSS354]